MEKPDGMSNKHYAFCLEYLKCYNATHAYMEVYNCSRATAGANGHELLKRTEIQKFLKTYWRTNAMGIDELFEHLADMARGLGPEFYVDGKLDFAKVKAAGKTNLIAGITEYGKRTAYKLYSREKALEMIARGAGAFKDQLNQTGDITVQVTIKGENDDEENE